MLSSSHGCIPKSDHVQRSARPCTCISTLVCPLFRGLPHGTVHLNRRNLNHLNRITNHSPKKTKTRELRTMMLDLFHESLTSKGISCDRQHFHGFLKAVDTSSSDLAGNSSDFAMENHPFFMAKSLINGPCSIAILVYWRLSTTDFYDMLV
jgi:hypothetical protein